MDPEQPIPASVSVDLPVSRAPTMQFPEPPLYPPSPLIDSELPEVLQNDPNIAQPSQQKLFVFMFQFFCII